MKFSRTHPFPASCRLIPSSRLIMEGVRVGRNTWNSRVNFVGIKLALTLNYPNWNQITHSHGRASHLAEIDIPEEIVDQQLLYVGKMIFRFCEYQLEESHDLKLKYRSAWIVILFIDQTRSLLRLIFTCGYFSMSDSWTADGLKVHNSYPAHISNSMCPGNMKMSLNTYLLKIKFENRNKMRFKNAALSLKEISKDWCFF